MASNFQFESVVQESAQIDTFSIVLYGEGKIGKTETVSRLPATAVLPLEPGGIDHVSGFKMNVFKPRGAKRFTDMEEFVAGCSHIAQSKKVNGESIRCVVVDGATFFTGDQVRMLAQKKGWKDPRAAYRVITDHMRTAISILLNSGLSVIATGHHRATQGAEGKAIAEALGQPYNKDKSVVSLDLNPALMVPFIGGFSHIGYCYRKQGKTMVLFRSADTKDAQIVAGSRGDVFPQTMVLSTQNLIDVMRKAKSTPAKAPTASGPVDGDPPPRPVGNIPEAQPNQQPTKTKPTAAFISFQNTVKELLPNDVDALRLWLVKAYTLKATPANVRTSSKDLTDGELNAIAKEIKAKPEEYKEQFEKHISDQHQQESK